MNQEKPLSYLSLKCILEYMDPNKRFFYVSQIPSLRSIHKAAPLKIDLMKLDDSSFTINDTKHSFAAIVDQPTARINGRPYDVDQFGSQLLSPFIAKGDIFIESSMQQYQYRRFPNQGRILQSRVKRTFYVEYTIIDIANDSKRSVRLPDGAKIRDVLKTHIQHFLVGSRVPKVRRLEIPISNGVLRLPEGFKLCIEELCVMINNSNGVIEAIRPIIEETSFPLKRLLVLLGSQQDPVLHNKILKTSESLDIEIPERNWNNVFMNLSNRKIRLSGAEISIEDFIAIARHWMEAYRVVGTKFSMSCKSANEYLKKLRKVKDQFGAVESLISKESKFLHGLTAPMSSTAELSIYKWKSSNYEEEIVKENGQPWIIVMEVMGI